jgi:hypothetical protein
LETTSAFESRTLASILAKLYSIGIISEQSLQVVTALGTRLKWTTCWAIAHAALWILTIDDVYLDAYAMLYKKSISNRDPEL